MREREEVGTSEQKELNYWHGLPKSGTLSNIERKLSHCPMSRKRTEGHS